MRPRHRIRLPAGLIAFVCAGALASACASPDQDVSQSAAAGAALGATAGVIVTTMFGGVVGPAAAVGAAVGGVGGAAVGGASAPPESPGVPDRSAPTNDAYLKRIRREVGPSVWAGLEALIECEHTDAMTWSKNAAYTTHEEHAVAGLWLAAITQEDAGHHDAARAGFPEIVGRDPRIETDAAAERRLQDSVLALRDVRNAQGRPAICS